MPPEGEIHPRQYEVLGAIWDMGPPGATATQTWERIAARRSIARTTVLTVIDKLEKRGWLRREKIDGDWHYWPTVKREAVEAAIGENFLRTFFGGSPADLIVSLIGERKVSQQEVDRLREILEAADKPKASSRRKRS